MELIYNFFPELAWLVANTGQSTVCQMLDRVWGSPAGPTGSREMRGLVPLGDGRLSSCTALRRARCQTD
jgi:hypothetical protein